ncbi:MAG: hypothetical protein AAFU03_16105, partial [Bacteroidota bacterium]
MSIWDRLFGIEPAVEDSSQPSFRFGRYTDAYKSPANYVAWDEALTAFEEEDFSAAFAAFFRYLRDEEEDNVRSQREGDKLYFEFYQGSKRVTGFADNHQLRATARIVRLGAAPSSLLQRLTALNYELKYSRFAIDKERCLTIVFDTLLHDASPHKLYHALKEMALQADKQDD